MSELYPSPDGSELCFCPTNGSLSDKNARSARRVGFSQVEPQIFHRITRQRKNNLLSQTPSYKYSFRLNEEQEIRFRQMLAAAGLEHNRSRFIVKRLFAERFEGIPPCPEILGPGEEAIQLFSAISQNCSIIPPIFSE